MKIFVDDDRCTIEGTGKNVIMGASYLLNKVLSKGTEQSNAEVLALICAATVNCGAEVKFDWDIFLKELHEHRGRGQWR